MPAPKNPTRLADAAVRPGPRLRRSLLALALLAVCSTAWPAELMLPEPPRPAARPRASKRLWAISVAALVAANAFDAYSSMGRYEQNPVLRGPHGRFSSGKALLVKSGASSGVLLLQLLLARSMPAQDVYRAASVVNFACAGGVAGTALANSKAPKAAAPPEYLRPGVPP